MRYITRRFAGALLLAAAVGVGVGVSGCSGSSGGSGSGSELGVSAFAAEVGRSGTVVVDVRTPAEFAQGHLAGAINVDVEGADFDSRIASMDKNPSYALYCRSGRRSGIALGKMTSAGFKQVVHLSGGVQAWTSEGRQLVTG